MTSSFTGFPADCPEFFVQLKENNNKPWFEDNRDRYNSSALLPAQQFVLALGDRLRTISPEVIADPRIDRSIFRLHRDTRFSRSSEPYKAHLGIWLWEGAGKKMDCSGYYFHIEPPSIFLGAGMYRFEPPLLKMYRERVVDERTGKDLTVAVASVQRHGLYHFGDLKYAHVPRGFDPNHPNAEFLKYNGLYAGYETVIPPELFTKELVDYCFTIFKDVSPIHQWVKGLTVEFNKRRNR